MDKNIISSNDQNDNDSLIGQRILGKDEEHLLLYKQREKLRAIMQLRKALKAKFEELLWAGKMMIDHELESDFVIPKTVLKKDTKTF